MSTFKENRYLVCIDSDGCAIDSMTVKHEKAFGPALIEIWDVPDERHQEILTLWNQLNLYTKTRGINRFQGLSAILSYYPELSDPMELKSFTAWVENTKVLSPESLQKEYDKTGLEILSKALAWSRRVNVLITSLPLALPFEGVREAMVRIGEMADIAVVSSANKSAIQEEWETSGLYNLVQYFFAQNDGTKSECIRKLIDSGYRHENSIMVGDAIGDYIAAEKNNIRFYPIMAGKETFSWQAFKDRYFQMFMNRDFDEHIQAELLRAMDDNLADSISKS
ncbi:HAD family hydrolase [Proteiniclasticum sp. C24MP]|uniref:HAD hydrolase-like protein n=1 Tax=Proteiniclasticum aestuarii TaxID=2817862 RepID=A0A939KJA9_9CLOT|nr:HAD hydrolase-like protein [Proteiniclasticum aestuarii]MBO1264856.1 HAD hydrolase-like protein [Proteiniclasticum aestuarii]